MKFYVINLDRSKDRLEHIAKLFKKYNLEFERVQAVDGKSLEQEYIKSVIDSEKIYKTYKRNLKPGEIGVALSHKKILQNMVENNIKQAIILEDDIMFDENLMEILKLKEKFPKDLELLLLGHQRQVYQDDGFRIETPFSRRFDLKLNDKYHIKRIVGGGYGAWGYYITLKGATKMLKELQIITRPYDHYTIDDKITNLYAIFPIVIQTDNFNTSSTQNIANIKKRPKIAKYFKRFRKEVMFFIPSFKKLRKYEN